MEHPEKNTIQGLTVGPVTENLLLSLRALEQAKNYYYLALSEQSGELEAGAALGETWEEWAALGELLEKAITDELRTWANNATETNEI